MEDSDKSLHELTEQLQRLRRRVSEAEVSDARRWARVGESVERYQQNYRDLVEKTNSIILRWENGGRIKFLNRYGLDFFGYESDEIVGRNVIGSIVPAVDNQGRNLTQMIEDIFHYPERFEKNQNENIRRNGERVWISWTNEPIFDEQGRVKEILSIGNDHTELKEAEQKLLRSRARLEEIVATRTRELRESEDKYRILLQNATIGIMLVNGDGCVLEFNPPIMKMLDFSNNDNSSPMNVFESDPFVTSGISGLFTLVSTENNVIDREISYVRRSGRQTYLRVVVTVKNSKEGKIEGFLAVIEDVTSRKLAHQALRESEERFRSLLESSPDAIVVYDGNGQVTYVNPAFEWTFGWTKSDLMGKKIDYVPEEERQKSFETLQRLLGGEIVPAFETRRMTKDGKCLDIYISAALIKDDAGNRSGSIVTLRDITLQKSMRAQLLHSQKMEAIGTLASGVAHDFNNLLQIILGYSQVILGEQGLKEPHVNNIRKIYDAGRRGADLVKNLLTFSRKVETTHKLLNINHEISEIHRLILSAFPKTIEIELRLDDNLDLVQADRSQIGQVLMNLAVNARDAMPNGGALTFQTDNVALCEPYHEGNLDIEPGNYVLITVSDSGHGMSAETLDRIFEPFFTTKRLGEGTGLGLATIYGIVRQHNGYVHCSSQPEMGTTFRVYLPSLQTNENSLKSSLEIKTAGGQETILLVEDEDDIRQLCMELLTECGYSVITAKNGREAVEIYREQGSGISLILLDLIMPEMDGNKCAAHIMNIDPKAKIIIASGFSPGESETRKIGRGPMKFVPKPYDVDELLQCVRYALDHD